MASEPEESEDLREYYITPLYLEVLKRRIASWNPELVKEQLRLFQENLSDYPELLEVLEGELYRRELNEIRIRARRSPTKDLKKIMSQYGKDADKKEIVMTELLIREGQKRLPEQS